MDLNNLMQKAQEMQEKMKDNQEKLANRIFKGEAGGGLVKIELTGAKKISSIDIDETLLKSEDKEILQDLIMAAFEKASADADAESQAAFGDLTGGIDLPFDLKF